MSISFKYDFHVDAERMIVPIWEHNRPASKTPFGWRFAGGPIVARFYVLTRMDPLNVSRIHSISYFSLLNINASILDCYMTPIKTSSDWLKVASTGCDKS